ncbi:unnamed protein product [Caenorhabditis sp. 36 PRJEB53466]|nr:unnamed protein product [Caenorhabditis sp. 36 PRJEB53466]
MGEPKTFPPEQKSVGVRGDSKSTPVSLGDQQLIFTTEYTQTSLSLKYVVAFAACQFSGPIAVAYSPKPNFWYIWIKTISGRILKQHMAFNDPISMEWTRAHCLLVLNKPGRAHLFSSLGEKVSEVAFDTQMSNDVYESRTFATSRGDSGIAVMDKEGQVSVVNSVSEPVIWSMKPPYTELPTAWTAFQPHSQLTHILLIFEAVFLMGCQGEALTVQHHASAWVDANTKYVRCVVDDARSRIAMMTVNGKIQIVSIDLSTCFCSVEVKDYDIAECINFGWTGTSVVFVQMSPAFTIFINVSSRRRSEDKVLIYEKMTENARISVETDGIRIFESTRVEFVEAASREKIAVLTYNSTEDGAHLYKAAQELSQGTGHNSFAASTIIQNMYNAINDCIGTACDTWSPDEQQMLLRAARLGMAYTNTTPDTTKLMRAIKEIRVLNELREVRTGIPLTHRQYQMIGETCLINRLIDIGSYGVAINVAQWLNGETSENVDRVLMEWVRRAISKVANSSIRPAQQELEALEEKISAKLLQFPHVSIADAARKAIDAKLPELARLFIRRESDDENHVAVLLQLNDVSAALQKAAASQRPQLIHQVVRHLMTSESRSSYELAISRIPLAQCLYQDLVRQEGETRGTSSRQMLALLEQASDFERQTLFHFDVAETERNPDERLNALKRAKDAAKSMGDKAIEEILSDVSAFAPLQIQRGQADLSVRDNVIEMAHDAAKVAQLKHQARLTDKQVYLWTIEGLAKKGKMEQLFDMAQKKSPVGYAPFVKACMRYKRFDEVKKYFAKVNGYPDLVAAHMAMKNFVEAAKLAYDRRDREVLHGIHMKSYEDLKQYGQMSASKLWSCTETVLNGGIKLFLYSSKTTKLRVAIGEVPGPMVHGAVSFVTEADSDDGLPHTLEHLVFMGSKKYPFKGVLDVIANRCLADGTNAWTDTDHTAYTLSTVGSDGFLKVLPVYISHLLSPMLTASQFATEVHHITGEGNDAGVVYSEMQDHESEMESIMDRKMKEVIYPPFNPYAVDTGGRLKNLRESCTLQKVRAYHKKFYHLSNMVVTVCGMVDHKKVLDIMENVEKEHLANVPAHFPTPFSFALPEIKDSSVHKIQCPTDDASRGSVEVAWFAHHPSDLETHSSLHVLFDYLSNTSVSPLQKDFILLEDPLASSVSFHIAEGVKCDMRLNFAGVPVEKLELVGPKFFDKTVREHLEEPHWDMERMGYLIDQSILNELVKLETNAPKDIISHIIGHQLFDNGNVELLRKRTNEIDFLKKLKTEPAAYWVALVKKYFTAPNATVIGVPDEELVEKIAKEEENRIAAQCEKLGEDGLEEKGKILEEAIKENTANHPSAELLDQLIVKQLEAFDRFPVQSLTSGSPSLTPQQSVFLAQFPFHANLHNCPTKFVELNFLLDSSNMSIEDRSLLFLYTDLLFESPAMIDGVLTSADDIAKLFTKDLIDHSIQVGVSGLYDRFVSLRIKVGADKYPLLAKWAQIFTQGIVFDASRVQMCAQKLAGEARDRKRDGCTVASTAVASLVYQKNTNCLLFDELVLEKLHEKLSKEAVKNPDSVIAKLEKVRSALFSSGINVHFIANVDRIDPKLLGANQWSWVQADKRFGKGEKFSASAGEGVALQLGKQLLIGVGGSESSFIYQTGFLDADWNSDVLIPTMVFGQYLSQCEGPLWRAIRGDGLAYGANIFVKPDRKQITLSLFRCAQPALAYERTREIIRKIVESGEISEAEFEGAKRSLVFEMMKREGTVSSAAKISILNNFRKTPHPYNIDLCRRIWNLTSAEMVKIGGPPMSRVFDESSYVRSIAVHPSKIAEMKKAFPGSAKIKISDLQLSV